MQNPMIHIYSGDGKGKTTAGYGLCLRASGCGFKVKIFPFLKNDNTGELKPIKKLDNIEIVSSCKNHNFFYLLPDSEKEEVKKEVINMFYKFEEIIKNSEADVIFLDEILDCFSLGLLNEEDFLSVIKNNTQSEIILTGRNPSEKILDIADYVSVISCKKHPYEKGIKARKGIEL